MGLSEFMFHVCYHNNNNNNNVSHWRRVQYNTTAIRHGFNYSTVNVYRVIRMIREREREMLRFELR